MAKNEIKLIKEFDIENIHNEFNQLINEYLSIVSKGKKTDFDGEEYIAIEDRIDDYKDILDIMANFLEQRTNISFLLNKKRCTINEFAIKDSIKGLKKDDPELYKKFLCNLNDQYKELSLSNYTIIIPINLIFDFKEYEGKLKNILDTFGLELFDPKEMDEVITLPDGLSVNEDENVFEIDVFDAKKALQLLDEFPLLVKVEIEAKMRGYAHKEGINRVKSFLGFIVHINKIGVRNEYFGDFDKYNIIDLSYGPVFIIKNRNISWPLMGIEDKVKQKLNGPYEKITINRFEIMSSVCVNYLQKIKSQSLKNLLFKSFSIYYSASSEIKLEYSFLLFWNVSEFLIKASGPKKDSELLSIMHEYISDFLALQVDFIYSKRNDLVHKGYLERINVNDRILSKRIADLLLNDIIINMREFDSRKDYKKYVCRNL